MQTVCVENGTVRHISTIFLLDTFTIYNLIFVWLQIHTRMTYLLRLFSTGGTSSAEENKMLIKSIPNLVKCMCCGHLCSSNIYFMILEVIVTAKLSSHQSWLSSITFTSVSVGNGCMLPFRGSSTQSCYWGRMNCQRCHCSNETLNIEKVSHHLRYEVLRILLMFRATFITKSILVATNTWSFMSCAFRKSCSAQTGYFLSWYYKGNFTWK